MSDGDFSLLSVTEIDRHQPFMGTGSAALVASLVGAASGGLVGAAAGAAGPFVERMFNLSQDEIRAERIRAESVVTAASYMVEEEWLAQRADGDPERRAFLREVLDASRSGVYPEKLALLAGLLAEGLIGDEAKLSQSRQWAEALKHLERPHIWMLEELEKQWVQDEEREGQVKRGGVEHSFFDRALSRLGKAYLRVRSVLEREGLVTSHDSGAFGGGWPEWRISDMGLDVLRELRVLGEAMELSDPVAPRSGNG